MHERYQGRCLSLESIPFPSVLKSHGILRAYGYAAWALRDILTNLMICDTDGQANIALSDNDIPSKGLGCFPRLEYLYYNTRDMDRFYNIGSLIQDSQSLKTLYVECDKYCEPASIDTANSTPVKPVTNIKTFKGGDFIPTDGFFKYLVRLFPKLDCLDLSFKSLDYFMDAESTEEHFIPADISAQFLLHVYNNVNIFKLDQLHVKDIEGVLNNFLGSANFNGIVYIGYITSHRDSWLKMSRLTKNGKPSTTELTSRITLIPTTHAVLPHTRLIERYDDRLRGVSLSLGGFNDKNMPQFDIH